MWASLTDACDEIATEKLKDRPQPLVREVPSAVGSLVAIHGAHADHRAFASTWEAAVPDRWTVVTPTGIEPLYSGGWGWSRSIQASARAVLADVQGLAADRPLVLTGFSIGSAIAAQIILSGGLAANGLIAVAPSSFSDFDELKALGKLGTAMLVLCGGLDTRVEKYRRLESAIGNRDGVTIEIVEGMGHQFPSDLQSRIGQFLTKVKDQGS